MDGSASSKKIVDSFDGLRQWARERGPKQVAVVMADDDIAISAISMAASLGIADAILIGDEKRIREKMDSLGMDELAAKARLVQAESAEEAASVATDLARTGEAHIILKGHLRTDQLIRAVLDKEKGLRTGRVLSDVLIYEDTTSGVRRFVGTTDGGITILPTLEQKKQIAENAVQVFHALGFERPKIAIMSATEVVTEKIPSTVDARALTEMGERGELGECEVYGPLALDNALLPAAAEAKGIRSPVAGRADVLVVPNIESGNLIGKAVKYLGGSACGHVIMGAAVPVLIPSRVESADDKLNAVALGVIIHG